MEVIIVHKLPLHSLINLYLFPSDFFITYSTTFSSRVCLTKAPVVKIAFIPIKNTYRILFSSCFFFSQNDGDDVVALLFYYPNYTREKKTGERSNHIEFIANEKWKICGETFHWRIFFLCWTGAPLCRRFPYGLLHSTYFDMMTHPWLYILFLYKGPSFSRVMFLL